MGLRFSIGGGASTASPGFMMTENARSILKNAMEIAGGFGREVIHDNDLIMAAKLFKR